MKSTIFIILFTTMSGLIFSVLRDISSNRIRPEACVFNTVFGEIELDTSLESSPDEAIQTSINDGLDWIMKAQHSDGGWGAGFHNNQRLIDPHKVPSDPATTAMVAMSLLRTGMPLIDDKDSSLYHATQYLLQAVENASPNENITSLRGTQIQQKLGQNIDLVLTTQYLSNLLDHIDKSNQILYRKVFGHVNKCVDMVQYNLDEKGRSKGGGWAGVLQSAFASNALESAAAKGAWVNSAKLEISRDYQRSNYDPLTKKVDTKDGAGVMLYSVSGSARANAKQAREAKLLVTEAFESGILREPIVNYENLVTIGLNENQALSLDAAYQVYQSAKLLAQDPKIMQGFGNNGGEEFLSFLQTGESLIVNNDDSWKDWYETLSANLINIQNTDGSWNGHHCITSPVFCTATCLLILSVHNDFEMLQSIGQVTESTLK